MPACRLWVLVARDRPIALVLRRGPAPWYHLVLWHTDTDRLEHGAWFKGRIEPDPQPAPEWAGEPLPPLRAAKPPRGRGPRARAGGRRRR